MRQDIVNNIGVEQTIAPITKTEGLTGDVTKGTAVDLAGCESAMFQVSLGLIAHADTTGAIVWEESATTTDGDFTTVSTDDIVTDDTFTALKVANGSVNLKAGYIGTKRYIRAKLTVTTGAGTGRFPVAVNVIKGNNRDNPVASV
jgi:hypothetical protein